MDSLKRDVERTELKEDLQVVLKALNSFVDQSQSTSSVKLEELVAPSLDRFGDGFKPVVISGLPGFPSIEFRPRAEIRRGGGGLIFHCWGTGILTSREYALKIPRPSNLAPPVGLVPHEGALVAGQSTELQRLTSQQLEDVIKERLELLSQVRAASTQSTREAINSAPLSHANVIRLYSVSEIELPVSLGLGSTFLVPQTIALYEWIQDSQPLDEYIWTSTSSIGDVINLLRQVLRGLEHIHDKRLIHWDLKAANCLVIPPSTLGGRPTVKIIDIGNARTRSERPADTYSAPDFRYTSEGNLPPVLKWNATVLKEGRVLIRVPKDGFTLDRPFLDLFMFGRMVGRLFGFFTHPREPIGSEAETTRGKFLDTLVRDWVAHDPRTTRSVRMIHMIYQRLARFPESPLTEWTEPPEKTFNFFYDSVTDLFEDLGKILPEYGGAFNVPELAAVPQKVIRLPVSGNMEHSRRIKFLIDGAPMKRLQSYLQLNQTFMVFPGAHHTRFEHSLGVVAATIRYVRALYADENSPDFRLLCGDLDIQALIFAAAIHDVGHIAFSHYLEEMEDLFRGCRHEDYAQALLQTQSAAADYSVGFAGEVPASEIDFLREAAATWLGLIPSPVLPGGQRTASGAVPSLSNVENKRVDQFLALASAILRGPGSKPEGVSNLAHPRMARWAKISILHSILDGSLDADKFDYVRRDAEHAGTDYSKGIDASRLLQALTTVSLPPPTPEMGLASPESRAEQRRREAFTPTIAIDAKGVHPVESLLLARYQAFNTLYWHEAARAFTILVQYLVWRYLWPSGLTDSDREGQVRSRRDVLLTTFRSSTDRAALEWLCKQTSTLPAGSAGRSWISGVLLERTAPPRALFDTSIPGLLRNRSELAELIARHELLIRGSGSAEVFCRMKERLVTKLSKSLADRTSGLVQGHDCPNIDETTIFVDVPIGSKDQVSNLWVSDWNPLLWPRTPAGALESFEKSSDSGKSTKTTNLMSSQYRLTGGKAVPKAYVAFPVLQASSEAELSENYLQAFSDLLGPRGGATRDFDHYSPLIDTIRGGFAFWARRVRLFVHPALLALLRTEMGGAEAMQVGYECVRDAYRAAVPASLTKLENEVDWYGELTAQSRT